MRGDPALIFDFDGTCAHLFMGYDFSRKKREMHETMKAMGISHPADAGIFGVFDSIWGQISDGELRRLAYIAADDIITEAEMEALDSSVPIDGAVPALKRFWEMGFRIAFATNNAPSVVKLWMERNSLGPGIPVFGREGELPELMKPSPHTIELSMGSLRSDVDDSIMIGDNPRDWEAAVEAGISFIGLGTTARKMRNLSERTVNAIFLGGWGELEQCIESVLHV